MTSNLTNKSPLKTERLRIVLLIYPGRSPMYFGEFPEPLVRVDIELRIFLSFLLIEVLPKTLANEHNYPYLRKSNLSRTKFEFYSHFLLNEQNHLALLNEIYPSHF